MDDNRALSPADNLQQWANNHPIKLDGLVEDLATSQTGNKSQAITGQPASSAPITVLDANDVLAVGGHSGWHSTPGGFRTALVKAMFHADSSNLALLGLGFPGLAAAVWAYKNELGGVDRLAGIVVVGISRD